MLRLRSVEPPFADRDVAGQAARLLAEAEAAGLWAPRSLISRLDQAVFSEALESMAETGVAPNAVIDMPAYADKDPQGFGDWIGRVRESIAASPVPERELPRLDTLFGIDRVAELIGVAGSTLRRYLAGTRPVPDDVAWRGHVVVGVVGALAGSYNDRGVRRWFERPRTQLDGRAPDQILAGAWSPDSPDVARVVALAAESAG